MRLYTDASHDTDVIGIGYVLRDDIDGLEITGRQFMTGDYTSMEAEYHAMMGGIHTASWYGDESLVIQTDCDPLVGKMKYPSEDDGVWFEYWSDFNELVNTFDMWTITAVPRHENDEADRLAREALWRGREEVE